jgi:hypothetical protein
MSFNNLRVPNNKFQDCPAQMEDGRYVTDYRPNVKVNNQLKKQNNIVMDNYKYRQFLMHNARRIIDTNLDVLKNINNCVCK